MHLLIITCLLVTPLGHSALSHSALQLLSIKLSLHHSSHPGAPAPFSVKRQLLTKDTEYLLSYQTQQLLYFESILEDKVKKLPSAFGILLTLYQYKHTTWSQLPCGIYSIGSLSFSFIL